jgi:hypothetical protein
VSERERLIDAVAFSLYLSSWLQDDEMLDDFSDEDVARLRDKWVTQWLPSLLVEHCGDCTGMPVACTRCHTERYLADAARIVSVIDSHN